MVYVPSEVGSIGGSVAMPLSGHFLLRFEVFGSESRFRLSASLHTNISVTPLSIRRLLA